MSRFQVQLAGADPLDGRSRAGGQARRVGDEQIDRRDATGLINTSSRLCEKELAKWARDKFNIEVKAEEMISTAWRRVTRKSADRLSDDRGSGRAAYARREIGTRRSHPHLRHQRTGSEPVENPYAADYLRAWVRAKFGIDCIGTFRASIASPRRAHGYRRSGWRGAGEKEIDAIERRRGSRSEPVTELTRRFPIGIRWTTSNRNSSPVRAECRWRSRRGRRPHPA